VADRLYHASIARPSGCRRRPEDEIGLAVHLLKFQVVVGHSTGFGMSFMSPFGAPAATHFTTVSISASLSDRSFSKCWMPRLLSMCQGGIWRV
jgi:hypothetical protein